MIPQEVLQEIAGLVSETPASVLVYLQEASGRLLHDPSPERAEEALHAAETYIRHLCQDESTTPANGSEMMQRIEDAFGAKLTQPQAHVFALALKIWLFEDLAPF